MIEWYLRMAADDSLSESERASYAAEAERLQKIEDAARVAMMWSEDQDTPCNE